MGNGELRLGSEERRETRLERGDQSGQVIATSVKWRPKWRAQSAECRVHTGEWRVQNVK